jgi:hypothetical protein
MLLAYLMERPDDAAFQKREFTFNRVRVSGEMFFTAHVFFRRMFDRFMREDSRHVAVAEIIIRHYNRAVLNMLHDCAVQVFRKESIYWFYSAQYRGRLFASLIDRDKMGSMGDPGFELFQAQNAFQQLAGPYINGYAFGDIDQLIPIIERVQKEGKVVPDITKIYPRATFKPKSEWDAGNKGLNDGLTKLLMTLKAQKASIKQQRIEHGMEAKFSKLPTKELPKGSGP